MVSSNVFFVCCEPLVVFSTRHKTEGNVLRWGGGGVKGSTPTLTPCLSRYTTEVYFCGWINNICDSVKTPVVKYELYDFCFVKPWWVFQ